MVVPSNHLDEHFTARKMAWKNNEAPPRRNKQYFRQELQRQIPGNLSILVLGDVDIIACLDPNSDIISMGARTCHGRST